MKRLADGFGFGVTAALVRYDDGIFLPGRAQLPPSRVAC
jgi:hypothetical protein